MKKISFGRVVFLLCAFSTLTPWISSSMALLLGLLMAVTIGSPYLQETQKYTPKILAWAVIGLGAGTNLKVVAEAGLSGLIYTAVGIFLTFFIGLMFAKIFKIEKQTSLLITMGTAICGGSAIAALAPVIKAKQQEITVALGVVFTLNALALFIFPMIGHNFHLDQLQFGLWSALAIHDTSSVIGAALQYGAKAVEIATVVKLSRALWIVPIVLIFAFLQARQDSINENKKLELRNSTFPWFILGYLLFSALVTWVPDLTYMGNDVEFYAKRLFVLVLFFIGSSLNITKLKVVGFKPLLHGLFLWLIVASGSLALIYFKVIT
jgi:uncharacterized integral membrane protein (TIGR00698 family)